jgi:hypothetical protein
MRNSFILLLISISFLLNAQDSAIPSKEQLEANLRFLASDALQGRRTGSMGNQIAGEFIATFLEGLGLIAPLGAPEYKQIVPLVEKVPPKEATLTIGDHSYEFGEDFIILSGNGGEVVAPVVFAGHGWINEEGTHNDYEGLDVSGKIVVVLPGPPDVQEPNQIFRAMGWKKKLAAERGAVGLIELYRIQFPWPFFKRYFGRPSISFSDGEEVTEAEQNLIYGWLKEKEPIQLEEFEASATLQSSGMYAKQLETFNVIGIIEGSDPVLKEEYMLLSAHYDHVGMGQNGGGAYTEEDSIFNGARDNGMGTIALMSAAHSFALNPPKRSVIILAVTGEEIGLLGSQYYADNPLVSLDQTVFNLNTDGAGYNDVTTISMIGFGRTGTDEELKDGAASAGLTIIPNPSEEQGLFDRSDNVSFARLGVPAITLSPGFGAFDEEIRKYYHQVSDEADTVDFDYLYLYCKAFEKAARNIANKSTRPFWVEGDKYENAGKALYGY